MRLAKSIAAICSILGLICGFVAAIFSLMPALLANGGDEMMACSIRLVITGSVVTVTGLGAACFCSNKRFWLIANLVFPVIFFTADHIEPIDRWGKEEIEISVDNATSEELRNVEIVSGGTDLCTVGCLSKGQEGRITGLFKEGQELTVVLESQDGKTDRLEVPMVARNVRLPIIRLTIRETELGRRPSNGGARFTIVAEK